MSTPHQYNTEWDSKTRLEVEELHRTLHSHDASLIQKQIAQAKLDQLHASRGPPPHTRKHRTTGASGIEIDEGSQTKDSTVFRNDEAFQKFEMGFGEERNPSSTTERRANKRESQATSDFQSVRFNHKAPGGAKAHAEDKIVEGYEGALNKNL